MRGVCLCDECVKGGEEGRADADLRALCLIALRSCARNVAQRGEQHAELQFLTGFSRCAVSCCRSEIDQSHSPSNTGGAELLVFV